MAAASTVGTSTGVRAPERIRRASVMASRRVVVTRSPGFVESKEGATTQQPCPLLGQRAGEPVPAGACLRDKEERRGFWTASAA